MLQSQSGRGGGGGGGVANKKRRITYAPDEIQANQPNSNDGGAEPEQALTTVPAEQVDRILPQIRRSSLEALLRRHMVEGIPVTLSDLETAPKNLLRKARKAAKSATNRSGWNGMDPSLMRIVLHHLNLREKVICVSKVCKAWNELKDKCSPGLFVDLSDESGPKTAIDMCTFVDGWMPKEDAVAATSIRLVSTEKCRSHHVDMPLYHLSNIKKPHNYDLDSDDEDAAWQAEEEREVTSLSDIKKLFLVGPKIKEESINCIDIYGIGPPLNFLGIDDIAHLNALSLRSYLHRDDPDPDPDPDFDYDLGLLPKFKSLEVLEMPSSLVSEGCLLKTLSSIGPSNITTTKLRVLDLTKRTTGVPIGEEVRAALDFSCMYQFFSIFRLLTKATTYYSQQEENIRWSDFLSIGRYCPKLEVLKVPKMRTNANEDPQGQLPLAIRNGAMTPMPHLHTCVIDRIISRAARGGDVAISTRTVSTMLAWLLQGMPAIESLAFGHGERDSMQSGDFPGIGNGLTTCPKSLREVRLRQLNIEPTALSTSGIDLDTIESITLEDCGDSQVEALKKFCHRYQGRPATNLPSLGICGNAVYMARGSASLPSHAIEIDID